jgi:hypothetical protein
MVGDTPTIEREEGGEVTTDSFKFNPSTSITPLLIKSLSFDEMEGDGEKNLLCLGSKLKVRSLISCKETEKDDRFVTLIAMTNSIVKFFEKPRS